MFDMSIFLLKNLDAPASSTLIAGVVGGVAGAAIVIASVIVIVLVIRRKQRGHKGEKRTKLIHLCVVFKQVHVLKAATPRLRISNLNSYPDIHGTR